MYTCVRHLGCTNLYTDDMQNDSTFYITLKYIYFCIKMSI